MFKYPISLISLTLIMLLLHVMAQAQSPPDDKLSYVLVMGNVKVNQPLQGQMEVAFGDSMPDEYIKAAADPALSTRDPSMNPLGIPISVALNEKDWAVQATRIVDSSNPAIKAIEPIGFTRWLKPVSVRRIGSPGQRTIVLIFGGTFNSATGLFEVTGEAPDRLDTKTHKLQINLRQANFPSVVVGRPEKRKAAKVFTAAKGKSDADIYFSGAAAAGRKAKPQYSIESKFSYYKSLKQYGSLGGLFTLDANEEPNIDPDSMKAALAYQYVRPFRSTPGAGLIFRSNVIGGEFDRKNTVRNLLTGLDMTLVLPSVQLSETTFAAVDFTIGFEAGNNYRNKLERNGLGAFWRPKFGANAYFLALHTPVFERVSLNMNYEVRLPRSAEIYSEMDGDNEVFSLTRKPRHHIGTDLNFLFNPAYGITLQYRYGTEPPTFKLVRPNVKVGFVVQLQQANK